MSGSPKFHAILKQIADLHDRKNADYAEADDVWGNFSRVAHLMDYYNLWNSPMESNLKVAICYQLKQFDCYFNALGKDKKLATEGLKDRLMDIVIYGIIQMCLLEEK